jgi:hypothetical protein
MKSLFRAFLFTVFFVSFFALTALWALKFTFLSPDYLKNKLSKADFYTHAHDAVPEIVNFITPEGATTAEADANTVSADRLGRIIVSATTPDILRVKVEGLIGDFYKAVAEGKTDQKIVLDIKDFIPKLKVAEADQAGVALEFLNSGDFGIKYPNNIEIPVPNNIQRFSFIFEHFTALVIGFSLAAVIGLAGFGLTMAGDWEHKLHSVGEALFWAALITAMFFGIFWLFFTAGNLIYREFSGGLRISENNVMYVYHLVVSIIDDFERVIMIICTGVLTAGLAGWIAGKIYIKKHLMPFQPKEQNE